MTDAIDALQRLVTRRATKAQVEAEAGGALEELRLAWATDTDELGICTNGTWEWIPQAAVSALDDLTDVAITTPQADDALRYVDGQWVNDDRQFRPVTHDFGSGPELVWDGADLVMEWF